jgi:bacterial/archaeal transporter family-2 protein
MMIFLAILAGVCIVISRTINAILAGIIGIFQGTIFNFIVGLLFSIIFLLFSSERAGMSHISLSSVPWWAYLGGLLGVLVVVLSSYITPKISAFYLTILIFIAQLFVGLIIDYLTLNIFSPGKIIGGLLVFTGLAYNLFLDSKASKDAINKVLLNS